MSGLNLRRRECVLCGDAIKGKGRIDRIYCSASCRTLAWRARAGKRWTGRRTQAAELQPGDYLPRGALTQFAMRLESELMTARRQIAEFERRGDVRTDSMPETILDGVSSPEASTEVMASPAANTTTENARTNADVSASALYEELERLRAELADERARSQAREKQLIDESEDLFHDFVEARQALSTVESTNKQLSKQLEELRGQLDQAQAQIAQLAVEREQRQQAVASASQIAEVQAKHQKEIFEKDQQIRGLSRQNAEQGALIEELRAALRGAQQEQQRLASIEQSWRKQCDDLQRKHDASQAECDQLRATVEKLRAMSPEQDHLMFLMRTKVKLLHLVAIANEPLGVVISGRRLPDDDPKTLREAAIYAAYEARQEYYASASVYSTSRTHWLEEGRRLDAESEEALRQQQQYAVKSLEDDLSYLRRCME